MGEAPSGTLGRYQIVKHLANGGMAQVLLARATGIEGFSRHVVVKRIHADRAGDPGFVKMFLDEARLAAALHHHNIVQVHDIGQEKGEYFFAMEYVHGEDLRRLLMEVSKRKQKVPLEHVITIIAAAASALHYAHDMKGPDRKPLGLVHRDVSPANILVGYDGNVKVVDFGIAKAAALRTTETVGGTLKGKVSYMAPEQCAGKGVDRRSDVYALGIVLYELTTVRRLFKGDNDFLTMSAIVQGNIPKPSKHRPDMPGDLEAIILKALALSPTDRYQSADEMRTALERFAERAGVRTSNSAVADYMKSIFGEKVEPWLTEDSEPETELTVDFDGSASGVAAAPADAVASFSIPDILEPTPSAPIVRARKKAITDSPSSAEAMRLAPPGPLHPSTTAAPVGKLPPARPTPPPPRRNTPPPIRTVGGAATATIPPKRPASVPNATAIAASTSASGQPKAWPAGTDAKVTDSVHAKTDAPAASSGASPHAPPAKPGAAGPVTDPLAAKAGRLAAKLKTPPAGTTTTAAKADAPVAKADAPAASADAQPDAKPPALGAKPDAPAKTDARLDALRARTGAAAAKTDARRDALGAKTDAKPGAIDAKSDAIDAKNGATDIKADHTTPSAIDANTDATPSAIDAKTDAIDAEPDANGAIDANTAVAPRDTEFDDEDSSEAADANAVAVEAPEPTATAAATPVRSKNKLLLIGGGVAAALVAAILVLTVGGGSGAKQAAAPIEDTVTTPVVHPTPTSVPSPVPTPDPQPENTAGNQAAGSDAVGTGSDAVSSAPPDPVAAGTGAGAPDPAAVGTGSADPANPDSTGSAAGAADPIEDGADDGSAIDAGAGAGSGSPIKKKKKKKVKWNPDELFPQ